MATTTVTLTGDVTKLLNEPFDPSRTKVQLVANTSRIVDKANGKIRLGTAQKNVAADGTFMLDDVIASTELVENLQYRLIVSWTEGSGKRLRWRDEPFGPYDLSGESGTVDVVDLEARQALDPIYSSQLLSQMTALRDEQVELSGIDSTDSAVAYAVQHGTTTPGVLSASIDAGARTSIKATAPRSDVLKAAADRARSAGRARAAFDDAVQALELWVDNSAWTSAANIGVQNGRAYRPSSGGGTGVSRPFDLAGTSRARFVTTISLPSGTSAGGICMFGVTAAASGIAPGAGTLRAIGFDTNTNRAAWWDGSGSLVYLSGSAVATGVWTVTVELTPTTIGFTLSDAARTVEYRAQQARPATIGNLAVWNDDARRLSGASVGPICARKAIATARSSGVPSEPTPAAVWTESWSDVAAWSPTTALQVSGGRAYYSGSGAVGAGRSVGTLAPWETLRATGTIVAGSFGGGAALTLLGLVASATTAPNAGTLRGIGLEPNTGKVVSWAVGGGSPEYITTTAGPTGTWTWAMDIGLATVTLSLTTPDGSTTYTRSFARPTAIGGVAAWNTDTRTTSGVSFGPITVTKTATLLPTGEPGTPTSLYGVTGGSSGATKQRIVLPAGYDTRKGAPLVIYCHGLGGTVGSPFDGAAKNFETALIAAGYIVAAADGYSDSHFGSQAAIDEYVRLYQYARDNLNITGVVVWGESMGGLVSLNLLAQRAIPGVAAYLGTYPITNLRAAYDSNTGWASTIRSIYGIASNGSDFATKTAGYNPDVEDPAHFAGIPMKVWHSAADTVVAKANNIDLFAPDVLPYVPELSVVATSGDHGDGSNFNSTQQAAMLAFLAKYLPV